MEDIKIEQPVLIKKRIPYTHKSAKGVEYTKYKEVWIVKPEIDLYDYDKN